MPSFSRESQYRLDTVTKKLKDFMLDLIRIVDFKVTCGHRAKDEQDAAFREGRSKLEFPKSAHNLFPSAAIDIYPCPVELPDESVKADPQEEIARLKKNMDLYKRWYYFGGFVLGYAKAKGIKIRWGGDWDSDFNIKDQNLNDLPHFEMTEGY